MHEQSCQPRGQGAPLSERQCLGLQALGSKSCLLQAAHITHTHNCACTGMEETSGWHWMLPSARAQIKLHRAAVHDSVSYEQRKEERLRSGHTMV